MCLTNTIRPEAHSILRDRNAWLQSPPSATRLRASSKLENFPGQASAKIKSNFWSCATARNSSPSWHTKVTRGSLAKCFCAICWQYGSLSTLSNDACWSMPCNSHAVEIPVPVPSSSILPLGLEAERAINNVPVLGSEAMLNPDFWVSEMRACNAWGYWLICHIGGSILQRLDPWAYKSH